MAENNPRPAVSIIVPIYNAERSLHRCVDSILAQTMADWELILVDDGSVDGSGSICDAYAAKDSRIKVIHKPNEGVAATRMRGMATATGEYTIQVDSDDWVEPEMLAELYRKAKEEDADVVICDFFYDYGDCKPAKYQRQRPSGLTSEAVVSDLLEGRELKPYCWNKLVHKRCYERVDIPSDISHGEDFLINLTLFKSSQVRVAYLPQAFYHYVHDENSNLLTRTYTTEDFERDVRLKNYCARLYEGDVRQALVESRNNFHIVRRAFNGGVFSSKEFKERTYAYRHSILHNHHIAWHRRWRLSLSCIGLYRLMYGYKSVGELFKKRSK